MTEPSNSTVASPSRSPRPRVASREPPNDDAVENAPDDCEATVLQSRVRPRGDRPFEGVPDQEEDGIHDTEYDAQEGCGGSAVRHTRSVARRSGRRKRLRTPARPRLTGVAAGLDGVPLPDVALEQHRPVLPVERHPHDLVLGDAAVDPLTGRRLLPFPVGNAGSGGTPRRQEDARALQPSPARITRVQHDISHVDLEVDTSVHGQLNCSQARLRHAMSKREVREDRGERPPVRRVLGKGRGYGLREPLEHTCWLGDEVDRCLPEPPRPSKPRVERSGLRKRGGKPICVVLSPLAQRHERREQSDVRRHAVTGRRVVFPA